MIRIVIKLENCLSNFFLQVVICFHPATRSQGQYLVGLVRSDLERDLIFTPANFSDIFFRDFSQIAELKCRENFMK